MCLGSGDVSPCQAKHSVPTQRAKPTQSPLLEQSITLIYQQIYPQNPSVEFQRELVVSVIRCRKWVKDSQRSAVIKAPALPTPVESGSNPERDFGNPLWHSPCARIRFTGFFCCCLLSVRPIIKITVFHPCQNGLKRTGLTQGIGKYKTTAGKSTNPCTSNQIISLRAEWVTEVFNHENGIPECYPVLKGLRLLICINGCIYKHEPVLCSDTSLSNVLCGKWSPFLHSWAGKPRLKLLQCWQGKQNREKNMNEKD